MSLTDVDAPRITFDLLFSRYHWKEIKNCPGRYVPTKRSSSIDRLLPLEVIGVEPGALLQVHEFAPNQGGRDPLLVVIFPYEYSGLITYVKSDRYVHTLNTPSGMRRKLTAMNIGVHLLPPLPPPPSDQLDAHKGADQL